MIAPSLVATGTVVAAALATTQAGPPTAPANLLPAAPEVYREARQAGGPGKDGIPSVDEPAFWSRADAEDYIDDGDRVIGIQRNGEARAYPQRILVWHEIVNDDIGGDSVAITYCPLTGTALAFERGDTELGVSGKLVNSNLVMYDRATDTEYPQMLGAGIEGPLTGEGLQEVRVVWTEWGKWKERHPDTRVLTTDTGYLRNYEVDPYGAYNPVSGYYREDSETMFPLLHRDDRYPNKYEILGFRDAERAVAVDPEHLRAAGVIHHDSGDDEFLVIHDRVLDTGWVYRGDDIDVPEPGGIRFAADGPRFAGDEQLTEVNAFEAMWFAWHAFYPDTEVIDG